MPAGDEKGKGKAIDLPTGTQNYFGSDDDDMVYADVDLSVGVEEGTVDEEPVQIAPQAEPTIDPAAPPEPPAAPAPTAPGGSEVKLSVRELVRLAAAESNNAGGSRKPKSEPAPTTRAHPVGGFHFPDGMVRV